MSKEIKQWLKAISIVIGFGVVFVVGVVIAFLLTSYAPYVLSILALICILVVLVSGVKDYLDDKDECKMDLDLDEDDKNQIG